MYLFPPLAAKACTLEIHNYRNADISDTILLCVFMPLIRVTNLQTETIPDFLLTFPDETAENVSNKCTSINTKFACYEVSVTFQQLTKVNSKSDTQQELKYNWSEGDLYDVVKLTKRSQPLVGRTSPYCDDMWRRYCCLTSFFPIVDTCLSCEDIARQSCAMVRRWQFLAILCVLYFWRAACSTFQTCILNSH